MVASPTETQKSLIMEDVINNCAPNFTEVVAFCPHCKNLETLLFNHDVLVGERRYRQQNGHVYHDCGSAEPCRLYGPR
jgi:hypothetical protein